MYALLYYQIKERIKRKHKKEENKNNNNEHKKNIMKRTKARTLYNWTTFVSPKRYRAGSILTVSRIFSEASLGSFLHLRSAWSNSELIIIYLSTK